MMKATFVKGDSHLTCEASAVNIAHLVKEGWIQVKTEAKMPLVAEPPKPEDITESAPEKKRGRPRKVVADGNSANPD